MLVVVKLTPVPEVLRPVVGGVVVEVGHRENDTDGLAPRLGNRGDIVLGIGPDVEADAGRLLVAPQRALGVALDVLPVDDATQLTPALAALADAGHHLFPVRGVEPLIFRADGHLALLVNGWRRRRS